MLKIWNNSLWRMNLFIQKEIIKKFQISIELLINLRATDSLELPLQNHFSSLNFNYNANGNESDNATNDSTSTKPIYTENYTHEQQ